MFAIKILKPKKNEKYWSISVEHLGIFTQGKTQKEAKNMLLEAVELTINRKGFKAKIIDVGSKPYLSANNIGHLIPLFLQVLRSNSGLSIREVAKRLKSKSPNAYARYETGSSIPSFEKFDELLQAIDPDVLWNIEINSRAK